MWEGREHLLEFLAELENRMNRDHRSWVVETTHSDIPREEAFDNLYGPFGTELEAVTFADELYTDLKKEFDTIIVTVRGVFSPNDEDYQ